MSAFTSKLGTFKGVPKSRIWLEGARLEAHWFKAGAPYVAEWRGASLVLQLGAFATKEGEELRKVSGRPGGKPIIDIGGARVLATFGERAERVRVVYAPGRIVITAVLP